VTPWKFDAEVVPALHKLVFDDEKMPTLCDVSPNGDVVTMEFDADNHDPIVTFDLLTRLSQLFGTTKIDTRGETRNLGGCETCDYEYGVTVVEIRNITTWPVVP
jgi:hypothetical protein